MSLKNLLHRLVEHITNLIEKILPSTKTILDHALQIVTNIKKFVDSPVADVITELIPGTLDDHLKFLAREHIPGILLKLKLADDEANKSVDDIVRDGIKTVQKMEKSVKSVTLQAIFQLLANVLTDDSIKLSDLQKIGQSLYEETKS